MGLRTRWTLFTHPLLGVYHPVSHKTRRTTVRLTEVRNCYRRRSGLLSGRRSDRTVRHGHISTQGSARLRWVLNQAAQTARRSPEFSATYSAVAERRGKKIATTAISRKLLTRAYHLLADVGRYEVY